MPLRADVKNPFLPKSDEAPIGDEAKKEEPKKEEPKKEEPKPEEPKKEEPKPEEPKPEEPKKEEPKPEEPKPEEPKKEEPREPEGRPKPEEPKKEEPKPEEPKPEEPKQEEPEDRRSPRRRSPRRKSPSRCRSIWTGSCCGRLLCRSSRAPSPQLCVNAGGQLIYARRGIRGTEEPPTIMLFDLNDESKSEKPVFPGANQFTMSADGKKLLVVQGKPVVDRGRRPPARSPHPVPTNGMNRGD